MKDIIQRSIEDWETIIGEQVRQLRIREELSQSDLAIRSNISVGALKNLENGKGSSLQTLIKVIRVLKNTAWLDALNPVPSISPIHYLKYKRLVRQRVSSSRRSSIPPKE